MILENQSKNYRRPFLLPPFFAAFFAFFAMLLTSFLKIRWCQLDTRYCLCECLNYFVQSLLIDESVNYD
ncbi:hypothetical protein A3I40_01830 [Candidatus Uhrbacteria bacterium RIFCSPLOWO2_02_FULL_48_12]|uniref:Uncharacterized protein n=1 Tax=Candidatus Uhrbacteria bacterium RIFCSPLOWO2_02_FULL_48_12 TaxID=1802407 RepID=A0A1F7V7Q7_9BACT|nr:MAG: hypothetical protein A3I40_01830 [Candidatus Uhrbacteria bacterium RIFCSPLOWO2_02_FULL_48_12]